MSVSPIENDAYLIKKRSIDVEVGDRGVEGFKPRFLLRRWDGERVLNLGFDDSKILVKSVKVEGETVKWKTPLLDLHYYDLEPRFESLTVNGEVHDFLQNEGGGLEFEVVFKVRPSNDVWDFPIQTNGLIFYYQPPLHPDHPTWADEDGDGIPDTFRPENVVGSYAVYHDAVKNIHTSQEDAEKYRVGKAFHIYRPRITDAEGKRAWAELEIDEATGKLSIILPHSFMDSAVYPVILGPNFGYETKGASFIASENYIVGSEFTGAAGDAVSLTAYYYVSSYESGMEIKYAIYKSSDNSLVDYTEDWLATEGWDDWKTINVETGATLSAIDYYLVFWQDDQGIGRFYYDTQDPAAAYEHLDYDGWPNPWDPTDYGTKAFSIYCTYSGGAPEGQPYIARVQGIPGMRTWGGIR